MAKPNLKKELPIILCDPNRSLLLKVGPALSKPRDYRWNNFSVEVVDSMRGVEDLVSRREFPIHAAVIYEGSTIKDHVSTIAKVKRRDPFMPQLIIGEVPNEILNHAVRAGVKYFFKGVGDSNKDIDLGLREFLKFGCDIFRVCSPLYNGVVIKIGGSAFDYDKQVLADPAIGDCCKSIKEIFEEENARNTKGEVRRRIVCTVGAGQIGDVVKEYRRKYDSAFVQELTPELMAEALSTNLKMCYGLFGKEASSFVSPDAFYFINKGTTTKKIPLIGIAPHYILVRDEIPLRDSDTHTIALAEFYGIDTVVLIKRTDGVYKFDPYRGFKPDPKTGKCTSYAEWKAAQEGNERYSRITLDEVLHVSRDGTGVDGRRDGTTGHLMEDSAIDYLANCQQVRRVVIVHVSPGEMYVPIANGDELEHIVTGERVSAAVDWDQVRKDKLRAAFKGEAYSTIVRE